MTDHTMSDTMRRKRQKLTQSREMFAQVFEQIPPDERKFQFFLNIKA